MIDLVAGYARGYNADEIRPFLKSLRKTGYNRKILLFADGEAAEEAKNWDVDLFEVPALKVKVHSDRFLCLERVLSDYPCEGIFLSDTRDVIFQKNPALNLPSDGLNVYEEDQSMSLGICPYNSKWIKLGYGEDVLKEMGAYPISCVGTTCGDRDSVLHYLKKLKEEIERIQPKTTHPQDQAAHNYLIRKDLADLQIASQLRVWNNEEGEIYTVGYIPRGTVQLRNNKIINKAGVAPTVIHQWDRHRNLENLVRLVL